MYIFTSLGWIPKEEFLFIWQIYVYIFKKLTKYFLNWLHNFIFLPAMYEGFSFSTSSPAFAIACLFHYSCSSGWKIVSHCGFYCLCCLRTKSYPSLCDPMFYSLQTPLFMGFPRQEYCGGWPFPSPGNLPNPGMETGSPALHVDSLTTEPPGKCFINVFLMTNNVEHFPCVE